MMCWTHTCDGLPVGGCRKVQSALLACMVLGPSWFLVKCSSMACADTLSHHSHLAVTDISTR
jgi:hypothetical protein